MSDLAWSAVLLAQVVVALIVIGGVFGFLRWLVSRLVGGARWGVRSLLWLIASASRRLALALQAGTAYVAALAWRAFLAGARRLIRMIGKGLARLVARRRDGSRDRDASRARGTEDPSEDAGEDDRESDDRRQAQRDSAASAYAEAVELMGLTGVEPLTNALLKQRYGELIRIVHPDKGFPNRAFAQQINTAVTIIRQAHGWR